MAKRLTKKQAINQVVANPSMFYKPMPEEFKTLFPVVTVELLSDMGLHFTQKHNGKMQGMQSLSTTCKCGDICPMRINKALEIVGDANEPKKALRDLIKENPMRQDIMVCGFCFSDSQQDYMTSMTKPLTKNYEILNNGIIHTDWIPTLNVLFFRGESFGDFNSKNAVINFFNLARKNPLVNITAWTKNPSFFYQAIKDGNTKPNNFKLILSSLFVNKRNTIHKAYTDFIDAVFTVYTMEYATANNIKINCGANSCLSCLKCYSGYDGKVKIINELLK